MQRKTSKIEKGLLELYQKNIPYLQEYPWEFEDDRWGELIICIFNGIGIDPTLSRRSVSLLIELGILNKDTTTANEEWVALIHRVLIQTGIHPADSQKAIDVLSKFYDVVNKKWEGYIQRFLRHHGERMVKELQTSLVRTGLETGTAKKIATLWLQNVCNIPILTSEDVHIKNFCKQYKITGKELMEKLDTLGLNVCTADDLIAVRAFVNKEKGNNKKTNAKSIKGSK